MQPVRGYFRSQSAALMAMAGAQGESQGERVGLACNHVTIFHDPLAFQASPCFAVR